jgi:hypothetical protein
MSRIFFALIMLLVVGPAFFFKKGLTHKSNKRKNRIRA